MLSYDTVMSVSIWPVHCSRNALLHYRIPVIEERKFSIATHDVIFNFLNFLNFIFLLNSTYPERNYRGVTEATVVAGPDMIPPTWGLGIITILMRQ